MTPSEQSLLSVRGLRAGYGGAQVLHGIDIDVLEGDVAVVLGANGAGKTTLMRALAGIIGWSGEVVLAGTPITPSRPDQLVAQGISLVPQGRGTLTDLSVMDNLRVGATQRRDDGVAADIEYWFDVYPRLGERRDQLAGTLSGGEQQMLAIARALLSRPRLLLCDEASLGLAPLIVQAVFATLRRINEELGTAILLVEQNASLALDLADHVYLLETGAVVASGPAAEFRDNEAIRMAYLGY